MNLAPRAEAAGISLALGRTDEDRLVDVQLLRELDDERRQLRFTERLPQRLVGRTLLRFGIQRIQIDRANG